MKNIINLLNAVATFGTATEKELMYFADLQKEQFDKALKVLEDLGNVKKLDDDIYITSVGFLWLKHYQEFYKEDSKELVELAKKVMDFAVANKSVPINKTMLATVISNYDKIDTALEFLVERKYLYSSVSKDEESLSHALHRVPPQTYWINPNKG